MSSPKMIWEKFFEACDLPIKLRKQYADSFVGQRIQPNMLKELDKDMLRELGVNALGDQLAILRYIKQTDGINAPAFKLIQTSNKEPVTTSSSSSTIRDDRHVMKAKATSSSRVPIVSRSIAIQKPHQIVRPKLGGLRSDEIIQERSVSHRMEPISNYRPTRPVVSRQSAPSYSIVRHTQLLAREPIRNRTSTSSSNIRDRITHGSSRPSIARHRYYD